MNAFVAPFFNPKNQTMSRRTRNTFKPSTKPSLDISSNILFPILSTCAAESNMVKPIWNCEKVTIISDYAKRYSNGDIFDGDYDERGLPLYGKLTFANGNVYEGPIHETWPVEQEAADDGFVYDLVPRNYEPNDCYFDEDTNTWYHYPQEEAYVEPEASNYGVMTYADGRQFYGTFCFGDRAKWA